MKLRASTKEDIRTLKTLAREKKKTTVIARTLKRSRWGPELEDLSRLVAGMPMA